MYSGEEKRKTMDSELNEIKIEIAVLSTTVKEWINGTQQYRQDLCRKQDKLLTNQEELKDTVSKLPCGERAEITKSVRKDLDKIWFWITSIVIAIAGSWVGMVIKK